MDRDRKSPALKSLQGKIWEQGYRDGSLLSTVFDDVPRAFERWIAQGLTINIFSSGSVLAQQLLFKFTNAGDLTPRLSQYFDTSVGRKAESLSYHRISNALQFRSEEVHFVSDVVAELDAAREAGITTSLCVRPGNPPQDNSTKHQLITSFDEL
jgi:enolase-phosphatase E1